MTLLNLYIESVHVRYIDPKVLSNQLLDLSSIMVVFTVHASLRQDPLVDTILVLTSKPLPEQDAIGMMYGSREIRLSQTAKI